MLSDGSINRHIKDVLIPTYQRRSKIMIQAIHELLYPYGVRISNSLKHGEGQLSESLNGGFFLYITFPDDGTLPSVEEIARISLEEYDLRIAPGTLFTVADDLGMAAIRYGDYLHGARLCWAWHEEDELLEGIERLAEVIGRLKKRI